MKLVGVISTAVLSLILGVAAPVFAHRSSTSRKTENQDRPRRKRKKRSQRSRQSNRKNPQPRREEREAGRKERKTGTACTAVTVAGAFRPTNSKQFWTTTHFRVSQCDYRNHRFQYGGYAFGFVDPWPSNWLYTQNVYVIEINGVYYLCNASFPGVNLALSFTL